MTHASIRAFSVAALGRGSILAVQARSGRSFVRHSHEQYGVGLMTGGAQRSWSGRGTVEATRGDLITVNPGEIHDGLPIGEERSWSMLYFDVAIVDAAVADISEGIRGSQELTDPVLRDATAAARFVEANAAATIAGIGEGGYFEECSLALFACLFRPKPVRSAEDASRLQLVRERIDDDPAGHYSLTELAVLAGLSRFQTIRAFRRLTGLTPHAFVVQRRLEVCRAAIRRGAPLAEAAGEAAFADQSHMHRAFVARYGMTPSTYARAFKDRSAI